jgi:hypothetical protein
MEEEMKRIVLAIALLVSLPAWGSAKDSYYVTQGATSCGSYVEQRKDQESSAYKDTAMWVSGYLIAYNFLAPDTTNIRGNPDLNDAMLWLEKWCRANPLKSVADGMEALTN